jgi:thiol-disulfide isomerase/thioredoxin
MKRILLSLFVLGLGLTATAACAPAATASQTSSSISQVVGMYPPQNLALISTTGRNQFIHSYADWCTTCQYNHPIVQALMDEFGNQIDFINLNIDVPETLDVRTKFDIVGRFQYLFTDPQGNILQKWVGPLDQVAVETYIQGQLSR